MHQRIHPAGFAAVFTYLRHQAARQCGRIVFFLLTHRRRLQHIGNRFSFVAAVSVSNRLAQRGLRMAELKHVFLLKIRQVVDSATIPFQTGILNSEIGLKTLFLQ